MARVLLPQPTLPTLLCVDDDPDFLDLVCRTFAHDDFTIVGAPSAEAATIMLESRPIDVLVTDLSLPRESGAQLIGRVRATYPHVRVVVVTATVSSLTTCELLELGAAAYVTKPVDLAHIRNVVVGLLGECP